MDPEDTTVPSSTQRIFTRNFALGFLALFSFMVSYHALIPTFPIYLAKLSCPEKEIGTLVGIAGVAALISRFLVGAALTRFSEKSVVMVGGTLSAVSFLAFTLYRPFWPVFVARFFQGAAFACVDTAILALVVTVTEERYRGQAIGYILLASPLSMAIAASFGVFVGNRYGYATLFLSCLSLSLFSVLFSFAVKKRKMFGTGKGRRTSGQSGPAARRGARLFDLRIVTPALVTFLNYFVGSALFAFVPLYGLKCGVENPGLFFTAIAVMLFTGRTLGGKVLVVYDKAKVISLFLSLFVVALVILSFSRTLPLFVFVGLLWGTGLSFVVPGTMAYALDYAGSSGGTALGTYQAFMDMGMAVGPVVMGVLVPSTGYPMMFLCLALISLLNIAYFRLWVVRRRPSSIQGSIAR
jgi:predicted MFS family arabinose efflux permease